MLLKILAELARAHRRGGAHVDDDCAFREAFHEAVFSSAFAQRDPPHDVTVRQHRDDDVRALGELCQRRRLAAAMRGREAPHLLGIGVVYGHLPAAFRQVARHRVAHVADADETDSGCFFRCCAVVFAIGVSLSGLGELRRRRRVASRDAAEHGAAHEPRRTGIVEIEKAAHHLARCIKSGDRLVVRIHDLRVVRDPQAAERERDAARDGVGFEWRVLERESPSSISVFPDRLRRGRP